MWNTSKNEKNEGVVGKFAPGLAGLLVPIDSVAANPANPYRHNEGQLAKIMGSLKRFGQQKPVVADRDGVVHAGNGTLAAVKALGWTHIAVVKSDLTGAALRAFAVADNRTADGRETDDEKLAKLLQEIYAADGEAGAATGYSEADLCDVIVKRWEEFTSKKARLEK